MATAIRIIPTLQGEEADKFLASGSNWSKLMRIKSFANNPE